MRKTALVDHDAAKRAAQQILRDGLATYAEIAAITGRSRQVVRLWAHQMNAETARQERLTNLWTRALRQNE